MADLKEIELPIADDCGWVRVLDAAGNPMRISKADFILNSNMAHKFILQPGEELQIYDSSYCIVQIDDYNSGGVGLYIISHYETKIISNLGSSFGITPGIGSLSVFKKEPNGPLFICNNTVDTRSVGFKRL